MFTRQQIDFNFDAIASPLSLSYSNIKAYQAALFAYRINLLDSVAAVLNKYVPRSLPTGEFLEIVLEKVGDIQVHSADRLSLAIPFDEIMSYYDAKLLQDFISSEKGPFLDHIDPFSIKTNCNDNLSSDSDPYATRK